MLCKAWPYLSSLSGKFYSPDNHQIYLWQKEDLCYKICYRWWLWFSFHTKENFSCIHSFLSKIFLLWKEKLFGRMFCLLKRLAGLLSCPFFSLQLALNYMHSNYIMPFFVPTPIYRLTQINCQNHHYNLDVPRAKKNNYNTQQVGHFKEFLLQLNHLTSYYFDFICVANGVCSHTTK